MRNNLSIGVVVLILIVVYPGVKVRVSPNGEKQNLKPTNRLFLRLLGKNEDGVRTQDTRDKQNLKSKNENDSTVEVEHQHLSLIHI